ncbi:class I SAM-dependent rRNA methyltransferase [Enterococcus gallinarum]|uniref:class I SAM-dependent rRNA methyltransferase n=1 Tax=Enterococcus gallinarum TaxID=1353 RepID=UPI0012E2694B|nr:class I SAM-dependent rRNA methyltransferase [Enterococcus gallinarum]MUO32453.1 class I SAM-dependent rRNA methyltransferase [Enterococcus gallinarum]
MKMNLSKKGIKKFHKKNPLIQEDDLLQVKDTQDWVSFVDSQGKIVGTGYLGKQNKGIGWVLAFEDRPINKDFFEAAFAKAKAKRSAYYASEETDAFRIVNGEGDHLGGLTIDLYREFAVFSWYNETLYQNKSLLIQAFQQVFPEVKGAVEKIRFDSDLPESAAVYGEEAPEPLIVKENGVHYATYLNEGLMTGIFLDQKEVRGQLAEGLSAGMTVLNMFSYTGAFSVAAAMGGATKTTSVDLAKRSLEKTKEQFAINGFDPEKQKIHVMDVFGYFKYAKKKELTFDMIILDPPSFARNKKKVFSVAKNYGDLVTDSLAIMNKEGLLIASTNAANLSPKKFQQMIEEAMDQAQVTYKCTQEYRLPSDFAVDPNFLEGNYLKVFFYQIKKE